MPQPAVIGLVVHTRITTVDDASTGSEDACRQHQVACATESPRPEPARWHRSSPLSARMNRHAATRGSPCSHRTSSRKKTRAGPDAGPATHSRQPRAHGDAHLLQAYKPPDPTSALQVPARSWVKPNREGGEDQRWAVSNETASPAAAPPRGTPDRPAALRNRRKRHDADDQLEPPSPAQPQAPAGRPCPPLRMQDARDATEHLRDGTNGPCLRHDSALGPFHRLPRTTPINPSAWIGLTIASSNSFPSAAAFAARTSPETAINRTDGCSWRKANAASDPLTMGISRSSSSTSGIQRSMI